VVSSDTVLGPVALATVVPLEVSTVSVIDEHLLNERVAWAGPAAADTAYDCDIVFWFSEPE